MYSFSLRLYPRSFRSEFEDEMLMDFMDMLRDVREKGRLPFILFCLRELVDFPLNLLRVHLKKGRVFKLLRIQPLNYGLRSAIGFGVGFAGITFLGWKISGLLFSAFDPLLQSYTIWYWETFQNQRWIWLFDNMLKGLSFVLTGILFGLLFALLAGDRRKRSNYLLAGALAWFIPNVMLTIMAGMFGWSFFLNEDQMNILGKLNLILAGMFYSTALVIAESENKESLRRLVIATILCPLGTYLYIKLLFYLWLEITAWFFPALMILMLILLSSMFIIPVRGDRRSFWIIMAGGVAYPLLFYGVSYLIYSPYSPKMIMLRGEARFLDYVDLTFNHAVSEAILGLCFGLLVGLFLGFKKMRELPSVVS
jgi:hypothetical protein